MMQLTEEWTGEGWRVGDKVRVRCVGADVSSGRVDFELTD